MQRRFVHIGLALSGAFALALPANAKTITLAQAKEAIASAGPPASDAAVAAAYPGFNLHPDHPPRAWFVTSTDSGCLYLVASHVLDPKKDPATDVVEYERDVSNVRWEGSPCTPGQFITGNGVLTYYDTEERNTGRAVRSYVKFEGLMIAGAWHGLVKHSYGTSWNNDDRTSYSPSEYFGGCLNMNPRYASPGIRICQPRVPAVLLRN